MQVLADEIKRWGVYAQEMWWPNLQLQKGGAAGYASAVSCIQLQWVAQIMRTDEEPHYGGPKKRNTREVLVALNMDAVPKDLLCSHAGCTARPFIVL